MSSSGGLIRPSSFMNGNSGSSDAQIEVLEKAIL